MRQDIKSNFEQINKAVITLMTQACTVDGEFDPAMKETIEGMRFVDVYDGDKHEDPDSMIIVVEPDGEGPEFIMFNPNEDKLP